MEKIDQNQKCPCMGKNLDKLIQPAILTILIHTSLHGYVIVKKLSDISILQGETPDSSGVYRCLKLMEQRNLVVGKWDINEAGPAKKFYTITENGKTCLKQWFMTLKNYNQSLEKFLIMIEDSLF